MAIEDHRIIINPEALDFHPQLLADIATGLPGTWVSEKTARFMDGSPYAKIGGDLPQTAVVPMWLSGDIESQLMRVMEVGNALTHTEKGYEARVNDILYVFPYLEGRGDQITRVRPEVGRDSYDSLQDHMAPDGYRRLVEGETVYAELFAQAIAYPGHATKVILLDPHSVLVHRYMKREIAQVLTLTAVPLFAQKVREEGLVDENTVVVSPDFGALSRAGLLASLLQVPLVLCDKWRPKHNNAKVSLKYGSVYGKRVIGIDEVVDTANTIVEGSHVLMEEGAREVIVLSTGAKLTGPAISRLYSAFQQKIITKAIFSDSLPSAYKGKLLGAMGCEILPVAPLLVAAIKTLLDNEATTDTYGISSFLMPDETPIEAYNRYQQQFDLPPLELVAR